MKRNIMLIGMAAAGMYALTAYAQPATGTPGMWHHHGPMMGGGPGRLIPLLLRSTDMTADQDAQAHQILDADRPAVQQLFTQLAQANKDLANLMLGQQDVKPDAVAAQQAVVAQLQQQLAQHEATTVMAIRALLTPDQLAKANAAKDQWQPHHGNKHPCSQDAD
jgi:Spy/CpxP family protein refolding chaperone